MGTQLQTGTVTRVLFVTFAMLTAALAAGLPNLIGAGPSMAPSQSGSIEPVPMPTETDPVAESRAAAEALANENPELADNTIIPILTAYLGDEDPVVREMAASAVVAISVKQEALDSGLRDAVRDDAALVDALYEAIGYYPIVDVGRDASETREIAVQALALLFRDEPSSTIETALTDQYALESALWVRNAIVHALGLHEYTSAATEDVFIDASSAYDAELAAAAARHLERLYELRGE